MPKLHFTDLAVQSLKEGLHFDQRLPAFAIRVGKTRKTWIVVKEPNRTKVRLGHYPALSLSEARKKALVVLGSPSRQRTAPTFKEAREQFLAQGKWRPRGRYEITRVLNKHFAWTKTLDRITPRDVASAIEEIKAPNEALHAFRYIRAFFNWCVPLYIPNSPCQGLKPPSKEKTRDRVLTDDELAKVWKRAAELGYPYGTICQLLITTGQRAGEIAALRHEWIADGVITIPGALAKNARESRIPFGELTSSILETVPRTGSLLFPARGHSDKPFRGFGSSKVALDKCGVKDFTHHDFRRTYATNMASLGTPIHVLEKLLNHSSGTLRGVAGIYNRFSYWDDMRLAVERYEAKLKSLVGDIA